MMRLSLLLSTELPLEEIIFRLVGPQNLSAEAVLAEGTGASLLALPSSHNGEEQRREGCQDQSETV